MCGVCCSLETLQASLRSVVALTESLGVGDRLLQLRSLRRDHRDHTSSALANQWRYTRQYFDAATGPYKMGARDYEPA